MIVQNDTCPWNVPVPVEAGHFVPLFPTHAELNVRVAGNPPYGCKPERACEASLLFSDLQTSLASHVAGRLGSGRSGFFRGRYVKGVGRTPLAANWNREDHLHSSGHLTASSAIREYVVSLVVAARGHERSIVACEGVLLAELAPELRDHASALHSKQSPELVSPVDRHLQAITVKSGGFARASNFVWLLHHLTPGYLDDGSCSLGMFCNLLAAALGVPGEPPVASMDLTPANLVALLAHRTRASWDHFRRWFSAGIWWGSFTNNFTLDGRFLDLETPAILMGPCVGRLATTHDDELAGGNLRTGVIGAELFTFISHVRAFCSEMHRVLANLPRWFAPVERDFGAELADEIARQLLSPDQPLGSRRDALAWIAAMIDDAFGPSSLAERLAIERLIDYLCERELGDAFTEAEVPAPAVTFAAVPGSTWQLIEPGLRARPFGLRVSEDRVIGPSAEQCKAALAVAEIVADLDHTTGLPQLLDKLGALSTRSIPR